MQGRSSKKIDSEGTLRFHKVESCNKTQGKGNISEFCYQTDVKKTKNKDTVGVLLEICEAKNQTKTKICTENLAQNV